jgi:hypothetical protein
MEMKKKTEDKKLRPGTEQTKMVKSFLQNCEKGGNEQNNEIEIRFQSVNAEMFEMLMTAIETDKYYVRKEIQETFTKYYSQNYRIEFSLDKKPLLCQQKRELNYYHLNFSKQCVKFSLCKEYTIHSTKTPNIAAVSKCMKQLEECGIRKKKRATYYYRNFKIDMTHIINTNSFEIEVEFENVPSYQHVFIILKYILFSIYPTRLSFLGIESETRVRKSYQELFQSSCAEKEEVSVNYVWENKCKNLKLHYTDILNHSITNKLNGVNYFLFFCLDDYSLYLINYTVVEWIGELNRDTVTFCQSFILQGELYQNKLYLFDLLFFQGTNCTKWTHVKRHQMLQNFVDSVQKAIQNSNITNFQVECKQFFGVSGNDVSLSDTVVNIKECIKILSRDETNNIDMEENDGLILTPLNESYFNQTTFKFKFPETMTIDFSIEKQQNDDIYNIYVYDEKRELVPFTYSNKQYKMKCDSHNKLQHLLQNGQIVECKFNSSENVFVPIKIRHDKLYPNYIYVATDVFEDILNPLTLEAFLNYLVQSINNSQDKSHVPKNRKIKRSIESINEGTNKSSRKSSRSKLN